MNMNMSMNKNKNKNKNAASIQAHNIEVLSPQNYRSSRKMIRRSH